MRKNHFYIFIIVICFICLFHGCTVMYNTKKMEGEELFSATDENKELKLFYLNSDKIKKYFGNTKGTSPFIYPNNLITSKKYFNVFLIEFDENYFSGKKIYVQNLKIKSNIKALFMSYSQILSFWEKNAPDNETFENYIKLRIEQTYLPDWTFNIKYNNRYLFCVFSDVNFDNINDITILITLLIDENQQKSYIFQKN